MLYMVIERLRNADPRPAGVKPRSRCNATESVP